MTVLRLAVHDKSELSELINFILSVWWSYEYKILENIDELCTIFKENPKIGGSEALFWGISVIDVNSLGDSVFHELLKSIKEDSTCHELLLNFINKALFPETKAETIAKLSKWVHNLNDQQYNEYSVFCNYLIDNMDSLEGLMKPEEAVKLVFQDLDPKTISNFIDKFDPKSNLQLSSGYQSIKLALSVHFEIIMSQTIVASDMFAFAAKDWPSSRISSLYKIVTDSPHPFAIPQTEISQSLDQLTQISDLLNSFCRKCPDYTANLIKFSPSSGLASSIHFRNFKSHPEITQWLTAFAGLTIHNELPILPPSDHSTLQSCWDKLTTLKSQYQTIQKNQNNLRTFKTDFHSLTVDQIKSLFHITDNQSILNYLSLVLNPSNDRDKRMLDTVTLALNGSIIKDLAKIYLGLVQLNMPVDQSPDQVSAMKTLQSYENFGNTMADFSAISVTFGQQKVDFETATRLIERFRYLGQFTSQLAFLDSIDNQFQRLKEFTADSHTPEINFQTIDSLEDLLLFFRDLRKTPPGTSSAQTLADFERHYDKIASLPQNAGLTDKLLNFNSNFHALVDFQKNSVRGSEPKLTRIRTMMTYGTFTIDLGNINTGFTVTITNGPEVTVWPRPLPFPEIADMCNTVRLTRSAQSQPKNGQVVPEKADMLELFMKMFDVLDSFLKSVCELRLFGYDLMGKKETFRVIDGQFGELERLREEYVALNKSNKEALAAAYQKSELMTLLQEELFTDFKQFMLTNGPVEPGERNFLNYFGLQERPEGRDEFKDTLESSPQSTHLEVLRQFIMSKLNSVISPESERKMGLKIPE